MNATRRTQILDAYKGHARRFDKIAACRLAGVETDPCLDPVADPENEIEGLSGRQLEVLVLVANGLSNQEICTRLDVTLETVKTHVVHILQRLRARTRAHAVGIGYKHGLLA
jgi:ATP/maltotriose-dependent transcriptional regulator MalT